MRSNTFTILIILFFLSCKNDKKQHSPTDKKFQFGLHVTNNDTIKYYYTISNQTQTELEANGKKISTISKTDVGLIYAMVKDSTGNVQLTITYDSVHVYSKKNDIEKDMDAATGQNAIDPVERLLGNVLGAKMYITLSSKGKLLTINGNEELRNKLLQQMNFKDAYTQKTIQQQFSQLMGESFVKSNLEQTISLLPDSTIYIGDTWQTTSTQSGEMTMKLLNEYTLDALDNGIAKVNVASTIQTDSSTNKIMGYDVASNLKGKQKGIFEINASTGMVINSNTNTTIDGSIQIMGREIPIKITSEKKLVGRKM